VVKGAGRGEKKRERAGNSLAIREDNAAHEGDGSSSEVRGGEGGIKSLRERKESI